MARLFSVLILAGFILLVGMETKADEKKGSLCLVVMDPLAAPLSCECVKGYAQRDYEKLARYLEVELNTPVEVHFSETLGTALERKTKGLADIIIGKYSVVLAQGKSSQLKVVPLASLTGKDGSTTQTGLIVVPTKDPALTVADLKGYRIYFGTTDAEEKYQAALQLFKDSEVELATDVQHEHCSACSDGAIAILDLHKNGIKAAAVISSYAKPLLEGCGTIKKGDLRVVGETDPVPFVTAFAHEKLTTAERHRIQQALLQIHKSQELLDALESKAGFVAIQIASKKK
ncbi:MAG TPA: PhnD/SsuA/transferrin family substrate-binding protein [Gemmatales bacterium]|nr:PhnD/SsuA/transferrin family substrate-binding protein [Gemmatales bacterium]HMP17645.1 PhnD/SsuA/transferrin family substrate-binding protein [Gemmatales bacterium]